MRWLLINSNSQLQFGTIMFLLLVLEQSVPLMTVVVRACACKHLFSFRSSLFLFLPLFCDLPVVTRCAWSQGYMLCISRTISSVRLIMLLSVYFTLQCRVFLTYAYILVYLPFWTPQYIWATYVSQDAHISMLRANWHVFGSGFGSGSCWHFLLWYFFRASTNQLWSALSAERFQWLLTRSCIFPCPYNLPQPGAWLPWSFLATEVLHQHHSL